LTNQKLDTLKDTLTTKVKTLQERAQSKMIFDDMTVKQAQAAAKHAKRQAQRITRRVSRKVKHASKNADKVKQMAVKASRLEKRTRAHAKWILRKAQQAKHQFSLLSQKAASAKHAADREMESARHEKNVLKKRAKHMAINMLKHLETVDTFREESVMHAVKAAAEKQVSVLKRKLKRATAKSSSKQGGVKTKAKSFGVLTSKRHVKLDKVGEGVKKLDKLQKILAKRLKKKKAEEDILQQDVKLDKVGKGVKKLVKLQKILAKRLKKKKAEEDILQQEKDDEEILQTDTDDEDDELTDTDLSETFDGQLTDSIDAFEVETRRMVADQLHESDKDLQSGYPAEEAEEMEAAGESMLLQLPGTASTASWPPVQGWVAGSVQKTPSSRSKAYTPTWPGTKREPAVEFKGNGKFDGGKSMRSWMKDNGVKVPQQMKAASRKFDFDNLEKKALGAQAFADEPESGGSWPPTNSWVKGTIPQATAASVGSSMMEPEGAAGSPLESQLEHELGGASPEGEGQGEGGQWPPVQGWVAGGIAQAPSSRSKAYTPTWPGTKREPAVEFKGNGKFDGGKSMRSWMKDNGVKVPQQMKAASRKFDFESLEKKALGAQAFADEPESGGSWPPTNTWVQGSVPGA